MKKLLLIDGNNLLFRSYYATAATGNLMKNSQGVYTNAVYGFVVGFNQILKMDFTHLLVAFDPKGPTFRHQKFADYKGTRKETPSELISQFALIRDYLDAIRAPRFEQEFYEADDIIGYAATQFAQEFDEIAILSNDRDMTQLLTTKVSQIISKKGFSDVEIMTPQTLHEVLGIDPFQIPDYKGMTGDTSDNIPGVPGIGEKTAIKLLQEYGTLENILQNTEKLTGKLKEKFVTYSEQARFSKWLATIVTQFETPLTIESTRYNGPDDERLAAFYQQMEFHTFLRKMDYRPTPKIDAGKPLVLTEPSSIPAILSSPSAIHLELFGDNYHTAQKLGFAIKNINGSFYLDYDVFRRSKAMQTWLADPTKIKYVYDGKQQRVALLWDGFDLQGITFDLLLSGYLINPNMTRDDFRVVIASFNLDTVKYEEEVYGKGAKNQLPDDYQLVVNHAISKADTIWNLHETVTAKNHEYGQDELLDEIEIPLSHTLAEMEFRGIAIDEAVLNEFGQGLATRIALLETEICELAGETFNINSPKQLGTILFEKLNLPYYKKTKSGYSTDVSVLEQLTGFHPIVAKIMEYRTITKLYSTYYEGMKQALAMKQDGRIHTIYKQAIAQTGRLSSIEPNLQNIPIRSEEGKELRKIFIPSPGHVLLSCDYSQIELRVLAEMGDCKSLKTAFSNQEDIHSYTARLIFNKPDITSAERRIAKAVNFGIIYGKTPWGLADDLHIGLKEAETFIGNYFTLFPEIKSFMNLQIDHAKTTGYVETIFKRRRYIPEVNEANYQVREFGKRMAMNAPIQGSAADILKRAMVLIHNEFTAKKLKTAILLQIHDELVFDVPIEEQSAVFAIVKENMEHAVAFETPLLIEGGFGNNLFEVK